MVNCRIHIKFSLLQRLGSVRKSGNDLWKMRMGSSGTSGMRRREWRDRRVVEMFGSLRRSESALTERG
jgi:hypothetical protein